MSESDLPDTYDDGMSTDSYDDDTSYDTSSQMQADLDGDGIAETTMIDFDGDGVADAFDSIDPTTGAEMLVIDTDGDGVVDSMLVDNDGDGIFDEAQMDSDGDGELDTTFDPETGDTTDGPFTPDDATATDVDDDLDDADTDADDDGIHGDPMSDIPYHQAQAGSNDCLPTSVAMILSEVTGNDVPAGDVVDLANELGLLGESGMSMEGGLALFEHYGVEAEVQTGSLDDLRAMLDSDTPVVIGLDSDDLYGQGDSPFADDLVAGHAVVITGIDDEAGLVYINDPGFPDGAGVAISIEDFEDAWQDADHTMIVAEGGDDMAEDIGGVSDQDDDGILSRLASIVMLPFDLVLR